MDNVDNHIISWNRFCQPFSPTLTTPVLHNDNALYFSLFLSSHHQSTTWSLHHFRGPASALIYISKVELDLPSLNGWWSMHTHACPQSCHIRATSPAPPQSKIKVVVRTETEPYSVALSFFFFFAFPSSRWPKGVGPLLQPSGWCGVVQCVEEFCIPGGEERPAVSEWAPLVHLCVLNSIGEPASVMAWTSSYQYPEPPWLNVPSCQHSKLFFFFLSVSAFSFACNPTNKGRRNSIKPQILCIE